MDTEELIVSSLSAIKRYELIADRYNEVNKCISKELKKTRLPRLAFDFGPKKRRAGTSKKTMVRSILS